MQLHGEKEEGRKPAKIRGLRPKSFYLNELRKSGSREVGPPETALRGEEENRKK